MAALVTAFAEYLVKFVIYIAIAAVGVLVGAKLKKSKESK